MACGRGAEAKEAGGIGMEKIEKRKDTFYYGDKACSNAGEAYGLFREDYHKELGKRVYRRLNRVGQREERVHGFGSYYPVKYSDELAEKYGNTGRRAERVKRGK